MSAAARKDPAAVETEVREKIHLEILKRTGAYHANDHILLPSGQHTSEYIEKTLVTTEPSFTEGLGAVIAKHFAQWPVDMVLSTGPGALILSHCVARAHPSRPIVVYGAKGLTGGKRRVSLPVEFQRLLHDTPVVVSQHGMENRAYGHYFGDTVARDNYPDRIVLYQDTLERDFGHDPELLRAQVERTLRHEVAHHLGWNEPGVRDLGL